ncbi:uncharacterized protein PGTG_12176 [Puccinia graminis f. sp. tritici CRL 75-36-700-3]|uniref:Uncharacterized protein n=1 Tax=Puccinia graminis f. sp. tritici (strain CRL 75-36-700-3 / race SCCL) TaxID=418459 RepID=E3KPI5_PUCGT|nr:uncharacterized protein PGTG_12176 [Puccinia graminis f. sp. tritici CRL 75-36-700-3]EFP86220.2 hypothetical protein PGTG_12176 [Puccinia graminis f. sp. tritici CRL 75-36-700-3]
MPPPRDPRFRLPSKKKQSQKLKDKAVNSDKAAKKKSTNKTVPDTKKQTTPLSDVRSPLPPPSEHPSDDEMDYDGDKDRSQDDRIIEDENDLDKRPSTIDPVIDELNQQFHQEFGQSQPDTFSSMTRPAGPQPSFHLEDLKNLRRYTKLDDQHFLEAFTILNTPGAAIPFLVMKEFERIQEGSQVQPQAPKDKSDEISTDGFAYSNALKNRVRDITKAALLRPHLDQYTRGKWKPGTSDSSLFTFVMQDLMALPLEFRKTHFPAAMEKDCEVKEQFFKMVREMHRRIRLAIRERLLKNIINSKGDLIEEGPVPLLCDIARAIFRYLHPAEATMTDADVDKAIPVLWYGQIGHLRLQTVDLLVHSQFKKVSQWALIDDKINEVKARGTDYRAAFGKAVLVKDEALFGQGKTFVEILEDDEENIAMPNEDEIQVQFDIIIRNRMASSTGNT